jgi:protein SCO1/2
MGPGTEPPADAAPETYGAAPTFTLTERSGEPFGSDDLRGKTWIASFIYSTCPGPCPMVTSRLSELQNELRKNPRWDDLRLVSFSVDPEKDTPERLRAYAKLASADPTHWLFLTGTRRAVWDVTLRGFKLPVEANTGPQAATQPVVHTQKVVLVDPGGSIRGYYEWLREDDRDRLRRDLDKVLAESRPAATPSPTPTH